MATDVGGVLLSAVPDGAGHVRVTVGVGVTDTTTVTMPAWSYWALGTEAVVDVVTANYRRTVRLLKGDRG